jgi:hypothetical protein
VEHWRCEAVLASRVAATANTELGGYAVFAVRDVPAIFAEVVGTLADIPTFT